MHTLKLPDTTRISIFLGKQDIAIQKLVHHYGPTKASKIIEDYLLGRRNSLPLSAIKKNNFQSKVVSFQFTDDLFVIIPKDVSVGGFIKAELANKDEPVAVYKPQKARKQRTVVERVQTQETSAPEEPVSVPVLLPKPPMPIPKPVEVLPAKEEVLPVKDVTDEEQDAFDLFDEFLKLDS